MNRKENINKICEMGLIIALLIALISFFYDFYDLLNKNTTHNIESSLTETVTKSAKALTGKTNSDFYTLFALSKYMATFESLDSDSAKDALQEIDEELPFNAIVVTKNDGTSYNNNVAIIDFGGLKHFEKLKGQNQYISGIIRNAIYDRDMIALTSLINKDGKVEGSISGLYYTTYFNDILGDVKLNGSNSFQVVDKDFNMVLLLEGDNKFEGFDSLDAFFKKAVLHDGHTYYEVKSNIKAGKIGSLNYKYGDTDYYLSYAPLGINDWYLIYDTPKDTIEPLTDNILTSAIYLIIKIVALFIILIAYIVLRNARYSHLIRNKNSNLENLNKKLKIKAEKDLMTGLYNKITSELIISDYITNGGNSSRHALFVIDIDDFKNINDEKGHYCGDQALVQTANALIKNFRSNDIIGRIGGDEFVVLLKNIKSYEDIQIRAEGINNFFENIDDFGCNQKISGSIGISVYPDDGTTYLDLFEKADHAMYKAKESGKEGYYIYKSGSEDKIIKED